MLSNIPYTLYTGLSKIPYAVYTVIATIQYISFENTAYHIHDIREKIRYMGKETISNDLGTFRCIKFHPVVQEGRVFDADKDLTVWITDDKNRIPVCIEAKLFVGSARMDLKGYKGLANPLAIVPD